MCRRWRTACPLRCLRLAEKEGLSLSAAGAAFLRQALQQDIDLQYSALLRPIIEDAIAKQDGGDRHPPYVASGPRCL